MQSLAPASNDHRVEVIIGNLLRAGVFTAASIIGIGGVLFLIEHGAEPAGHRGFLGEPADLRDPVGIVRAAWHFDSRGLIQLGILLLLATPVARVVFSVFAFLRQGDRAYAGITLLVLLLLLYSLFSGLFDQ